jgi:hypothetical protein
LRRRHIAAPFKFLRLYSKYSPINSKCLLPDSNLILADSNCLQFHSKYLPIDSNYALPDSNLFPTYSKHWRVYSKRIPVYLNLLAAYATSTSGYSNGSTGYPICAAAYSKPATRYPVAATCQVNQCTLDWESANSNSALRGGWIRAVSRDQGIEHHPVHESRTGYDRLAEKSNQGEAIGTIARTWRLTKEAGMRPAARRRRATDKGKDEDERMKH